MDSAKKDIIRNIENFLEEKRNDQRLILIVIRNLSKWIIEADSESSDFHLYMRKLLRKIEQLKVVRSEMGVYKTMNSLIAFLKEDLENEEASLD